MTTQSLLTVGQWAARHPGTSRVFARHEIDFCCGGGRSLAEVCAEKGIALDALLAELEAAAQAPAPDERDWTQATLGELMDHILATFHRPLDEDLPRLEAQARRVAAVHGSKDPRLAEVLRTFLPLRADLEQHMLKEEQILFPMIRAGHGAQAIGPITVMEREHDEAGEALRRLRELTDGYQPPAEACNTWRALLHGLEEFEREMHVHVHLENNVLYPRALAS